jgi:hypothetical protein
VTVTTPDGKVASLADAFEVDSAVVPPPPPPSRSPPSARLEHAPAVSVAGAEVTFDAAGSSDLQTSASGLRYSFDISGTSSAPPWSAWSATPSTTFRFYWAGWHRVRVAVLDADGDIGYAADTVTVVPSASALCTVTLAQSETDDGASSCAGPFGADGQLSLAEAARLSDANPGTVITFAPGLAVTGAQGITLSGVATLVGAAGVTVSNVPLTLAGGGSVSGLSLSTPGGSPLIVPSGATVVLDQVDLSNYANVTVAGNLAVWHSRFTGCTKACLAENDPSAKLVVRFSQFTGGAIGIQATNCASGGLDVLSSSFVREATGVRIDPKCTGTVIDNGTFVGNQLALDYHEGSHVLRNVIASANATAVACTRTPTIQASALLAWNNADDGCPDLLSSFAHADPLYVLAAQDDFRLGLDSPAVDAAEDTGADVNDDAPGLYFGAGPDLGANETW